MSRIGIVEASHQLPHLVSQAVHDREVVVLTSEGQAQAVLIGIEAFRDLVGIRAYTSHPLQPVETFQRGFRVALAEAGYDTKDKIVELVREVKREIADEKYQRLSQMKDQR